MTLLVQKGMEQNSSFYYVFPTFVYHLLLNSRLSSAALGSRLLPSVSLLSFRLSGTCQSTE